jgi:ribosome-associated protein
MAKSSRPRSTPSSASRESRLPRLPAQLKVAVETARNKKATAMTLLDLRKTGAFTDFFLMCTGGNPRQVQAIADAVEQALKSQKVRPTHVEGYGRAEWVLLDYFDFIVHVFSPQARQFYGLERLWGNAVRHELPDEDAADRSETA